MKRIFLLPLVAVLLAIPTDLRTPRAVAQQANKTITIAGLQNRVTVRRDERGIPYIEASNDDDLYFAQGYITASDRLFQMDLQRRSARGELSEIFGQGALAEDKRHRMFGFAKVIDETAMHLPPDLGPVLDAYTRGVNAYIDSLTQETMPPEFALLQYKPQPWKAADSLAVGKVMAEYLSNSWQLDIMRAALASLPKEKLAALLPEISPLDVVVVGSDKKKATLRTAPLTERPSDQVIAEPARQMQDSRRTLERIGLFDQSETFQASNNWVVSGNRTSSGKPLLANDPHIPASAPNVWYLTSLSAPGVHVAGVTFVGAPGIIIGHNDRIAWGVTNLGPDVQDVYIEKFDKDNPNRYLTPTGWKEAEIRHEQIKVRKVPTKTETETQTYDVTVTRHGPIVLEQNSMRYALRWSALDPSLSESVAFLRADRSANWNDFTKALSSYGGATQNFIYADVDGHIGYYGAGAIPIRKTGDGSVPYDGSTDDGEWTGWIPFDKLPHVYDPPAGIIVTANQRVVGTDYPYFLSHRWPPPFRARRIFDLLSEKPKLTIDDYRRIQGDTYSISLTSFARNAAKIMKAAPAGDDQKLNQTVAALESWDGHVNADSTVAPIVLQMRLAFMSRIFSGALGPDLLKVYRWPNAEITVDRLMAEQSKDWLPKEFSSYAELLRACYNDARAAITKNLGADESKWKWGEMIKIRFFHPLSSVPFVGAQFLVPPIPQNGVGGVGETVNVGSSVSMRLIADPSNWDQTQHGIPLGESGLPSSPHWKDQLEDWLKVTPRALPFSKAAVDSATRETLILEPAK
jgi:penicillin G amidase